MYNQLVSILLAMHTQNEVHCIKKINCEMSDEVKRVIRQFYDRERYYQKISLQRYISFEELDKTVSRTEDTVEYAFDVNLEILCKEEKIAALKKALLDLSDDERQIIKECFYFNGSKKPSYSKLAEKYNISRQAYCKRLDKILRKLKEIIENSENSSS